jgi:hypothetical protein
MDTLFRLFHSRFLILLHQHAKLQIPLPPYGKNAARRWDVVADSLSAMWRSGRADGEGHPRDFSLLGKS